MGRFCSERPGVRTGRVTRGSGNLAEHEELPGLFGCAAASASGDRASQRWRVRASLGARSGAARAPGCSSASHSGGRVCTIVVCLRE